MQAGAPSYPILTGRRDGFTSTAASVDLPSPSISREEALTYFQSKGLDVLDMATLLGKHTISISLDYSFFNFIKIQLIVIIITSYSLALI